MKATTIILIFIIAILFIIFFILKIIKKITSKIILISLAFFGLIFLLSFLNIAFFDFQCIESCNICTSSILKVENRCPLIWSDEFSCLQDCKVRDFKCSYNINYKDNCVDCQNTCRDEFPVSLDQEECIGDCSK